MKPGIYPGLPFIDYLAIDAVSNTRMGLMEISPAHYHANVELERVKPLVLGSLVHTGRLEPLALAERYAVMPDYHLDAQNKTYQGKASDSKATRWCKERTNEFIHANGDKEVVSREWYAEMIAIVTALSSNPDANRVLNDRGPVELTIVWVDDETKLPCKARLDKLCETMAAFADLKSCAELAGFGRSIARYGYHRQCAHYQSGWEHLTGETLTPWIVPVEKCKPHCSQAAPIDEETLSRGDERRGNALRQIAECMEKNHWPGPPSPPAWRVPEWELSAGEPIELIVSGQAVEM